MEKGKFLLLKVFDKLSDEEKIDSGKRIKLDNLRSTRYVWNKDDDPSTNAETEGEQKNIDLSRLSNAYTEEQVDESVEKGDADSKEDFDEIDVESTAIDRIDYRANKKGTGTLRVKFQGGSKYYDFPNVPKEVVIRFINSSSKGKFYNNVIKGYSIN